MASKKTTAKKTATKKAAKKAAAKKAPVSKSGKPAKKADKTKAKAASKAGKPAKQVALAKASKQPKTDGKISGLDAAAQVLAAAREPLSARQLAEGAIAAGWKTNGKTPHATLYAAIIREIANKGADARFRKTDRGRFEATGK